MGVKAWKLRLVSEKYDLLTSLGFSVKIQQKTTLVIQANYYSVIYYPCGDWWSCQLPIGQGRGFDELVDALNKAKSISKLSIT